MGKQRVAEWGKTVEVIWLSKIYMTMKFFMKDIRKSEITIYHLHREIGKRFDIMVDRKCKEEKLSYGKNK